TEEDRVKETFTAFQAAVKAKDGGKVWNLLDKESRTAAERVARAVKGNYAKASAEGKAKMEKALELSGEDVAKLTGESFIKSKTFLAKYGEVPGSKIEKIVVEDEKATVHYLEEDGDKEKLKLNRQDGAWKVSAPMPPAVQP